MIDLRDVEDRREYGGLQACAEFRLGGCEPAHLRVVGDRIIIADDEGRLFVTAADTTNLNTSECLKDRHPERPSTLLVSDDGRRAIASSPFGGVTVWDLEGEVPARHLPMGGAVFRASSDFRRLLLSTPDGILKMLSIDSGETLAAFQGDHQLVAAVADADLRRIAACDQTGHMHFLVFECP